MKSLTFNNERKPWLMLLKGRTKPPFASVRRNLLTIPGRSGAFLHTSTRDPLVINQPIAFIVDDDVDALKLKDELADWLVTDKPVPLTFDDEPGRIYYAVVNNTLDDFERFAGLRQGTIQFICPDPYGYSEELTHNVSNNPTIINDATAETYPVFEIDVLEQLTRLEIRNKSLVDRQGVNPAIVLGKAARLDQETFVQEELVFQDTMQSTTSWQTAAEVDNGYIAGQVGVDSEGFYPEAYGGAIEPYNWQGPSLIRGIGTSLQDFKADIYIKNFNTAYETGMLDIYLRDANSNIIGKIGFGDAWKGKAENFGHAQVGDYYTGYRVDAYAAYQYGWNNFDGIIRMIREDNVWRFYFAKIEADGTHNWVKSTLGYTDNARQYMAPITDVQIAFRLWPLTQRTNIKIKQIKLYRINQPTSNGSLKSVPYFAQAGDKIIVDTKKSSIRKNGEYADDTADLALQMFPFTKGYNKLEITPSGSVNVKARYRKAYL